MGPVTWGIFDQLAIMSEIALKGKTEEERLKGPPMAVNLPILRQSSVNERPGGYHSVRSCITCADWIVRSG